MYTRMLVPLDGSETAETVLPYARTLARTLKIPVDLIKVIEIHTHGAAEKNRYLDMLIKDAVRNSQEYLNRIAKTFSVASVKCAVEKTASEEVIIANAALDNNLIVMSTHGRSGVKRWLLGSIAEKVLHGASNPILLVRATENAKKEGEVALSRVIVPLDGSERAEAVLPIVVELATAINLKVILLRSYSLKQLIYNYGVPNLDELEAELKTQAISYLDSKVRQLKSEGLVDVSPLASEGEAAETIIELASGAPNSLIAMCSHGRSGVRRWVLGSVTEKVVRHSDDPVLVIRAE
jgi:nucleotide-binding universal stress UspA family protein